MAEPYSDEELKAHKYHCDLPNYDKEKERTIRRFLATVAADRDSLKADKEIMIELDKINTEKSKRIAELEAECKRLRDELEKIAKGKKRIYTADETGEKCVCFECEGFVMIAEQALRPKEEEPCEK